VLEGREVGLLERGEEMIRGRLAVLTSW